MVKRANRYKIIKKRDGEGEQVTVHSLFRIICLLYRVVSVDYFLNEMQPFEVDAIIENIEYIDSPYWEMTRLQMYSNTSIWSKKKLQLTDVLKFPWDNHLREKGTVEISNEDIERLRKKSKQYGSILK